MIDWTILITISSLIGTIANIYKKSWCFIIWLFTNVTWCVYDFSKGIYSQSILFFMYTCISVWGIYKWKRDEKNERT